MEEYLEEFRRERNKYLEKYDERTKISNGSKGPSDKLTQACTEEESAEYRMQEAAMQLAMYLHYESK